MASGAVLSYRSDLEEKLNAKRSELVETEETLKKYVGPIVAGSGDVASRPSFRGRLGPPPQRENNPRLQQQLDGSQRRSIGRGRLSLEGRLGPKVHDDDEGDDAHDDGKEETRKVMSRVVVEQKSREEALAEKKVDKAEVQRSKRMFGNLLGTLQRFKQDENKIKDREQKKRKIEEKIEEKTVKEREEAKKKKFELFSEREKKKHELKILEIQMRRVEEFEMWEKNKRQEALFIRTKKGPPIYFLPKAHNDATLAALEETMDLVEEEIKAAKIKFEDDILRIAAKAENPQQDPEGEDEDEEDDFKNLSVVSAVQKVSTPGKKEASPTLAANKRRRRHSSASESSSDNEEEDVKKATNGLKTEIKKEKIEKEDKKETETPADKRNSVEDDKAESSSPKRKPSSTANDDVIPVPTENTASVISNIKVEKTDDVSSKKDDAAKESKTVDKHSTIVSAATVPVALNELPNKSADAAKKSEKVKSTEKVSTKDGKRDSGKPSRKRAASSSGSSSGSSSSSDSDDSSSSSSSDDGKKKKKKAPAKKRRRSSSSD